LFLEFEVNKQGEAENVKLLKGLYPDLDLEIIRLLKASKGWNTSQDIKTESSWIINITYPFPFE